MSGVTEAAGRLKESAFVHDHFFVGFSITTQLFFLRDVKNNANNSLANQHGNGKWIC